MMFPKLVRNPRTPVRVVIEGAINEFGEHTNLLDSTFLCNYQESAGVKQTKDKQTPEASGRIYIDGDILPSHPAISAGHVIIFGEKRLITQGIKGRNLDGTVNYTALEVI